jgi:hypothetical protein
MSLKRPTQIAGGSRFPRTAVIVALVFLVALTQARPASAATAAVTIAPTHGIVGTEVELNGSGFAPSAPITIGFGGSPFTFGQTNAAGIFIEYFGVPGATAATYVVSVTDARGDAVNTTFTVDPSSNVVTATTTSASTTQSPNPGPKGGPAPTVTTSTVTATSTETVSMVWTETSTSTSTKTVTLPASTSTTTTSVTVAKTGPGATQTTTETGQVHTVTITTTDPAAQAGRGSPQSFTAVSDPLLYLLAGMGILVLAIALGITAFRRRANDEFREFSRSRR